MQPEDIARVCHEVNRAYCAAYGDISHSPWETAPAWQRASALAGVNLLLVHPGRTPAQLHEAWLELKRAQGWRYGDAKDVYAKTHPCMVPFAELPAVQQAKDYIFVAVVNTLAPYLTVWPAVLRARQELHAAAEVAPLERIAAEALAETIGEFAAERAAASEKRPNSKVTIITDMQVPPKPDEA